MTKIAAIQQPPVYLDLEKSMSRAVELVEEAARGGAQMVVFPEAWFPGYPTFVWRLPPGAGMGKTDELFARLQENSVDLSRGQMALLGWWVVRRRWTCLKHPFRGGTMHVL